MLPEPDRYLKVQAPAVEQYSARDDNNPYKRFIERCQEQTELVIGVKEVEAAPRGARLLSRRHWRATQSCVERSGQSE